ncbi:HEPN domain-containing protein [Thermococcus barophilus]|uniref:HEPN domain-containing protein n=1 Tax=Thermococcus barophilus TaxID=55802 RepID=A0A0S1XC98_THEBA|nr:HEPN domain-containing protein [Thermococcus barophilus]ALM75418.1 hypothetical protein TBCH5v1_1502 [Thermococcus barophilus]
MHYEEVELLKRRAKVLWEAGEYFFEKGAYDLASFNFEQSVQLELKAILLEYTGQKIKTHSIRLLLEAVGEAFGKESEVREFIRRHRKTLKH